ncbi:hypothetical protein [Larkinella soli]|uniref:hypothetical protein n=1 Tax=Larkinella soli TaxID=1770527 RepID=UPI000FFBA6CA|nr:hypothetical protein [Larkinella soli]
MKNWFGCGWLSILMLACTLDDPTPHDRVCLVTDIVRYRQDSALPKESSRQSIRYQGGLLSGYQESNAKRNVLFTLSYEGGMVSRARSADGSQVLALKYDKNDRIEKASFLINDQEQSIFSLYYNDNNDRRARLIRLVESRVTLPGNSFISSRTFQFEHGTIGNNTQDVVAQTLQIGFRDGTRSQERLTFQQDPNRHSAFYDTSQPIVLVLLALTNPTEMLPARFLQRFGSQSMLRRVLDIDGSTLLNESSTFTTEVDGNFNPTQTTELSRTYAPNESGVARTYGHTFQYDCRE